MGIERIGNPSVNSPLGAMPKDPEARLRKAANALEAVWITQLMKEARPKAAMLGKSFAAETFKDMLDEALGQSMADRGVLGLGDSLVRQLLPTIKPATAPGSGDSQKGPHS